VALRARTFKSFVVQMVYFEDRHKEIKIIGKYPAAEYDYNPMRMLSGDDIKLGLVNAHAKKTAYKCAVILVKCGNRTAPKIYRFDSNDNIVEV